MFGRYLQQLGINGELDNLMNMYEQEEDGGGPWPLIAFIAILAVALIVWGEW